MKNKGAKEEDVARQRDQYLSTKENIVLYDPESFSSQAELEKKKIEKETDIETSTIPVKTEQEFKDAWERANNSDSVTLFFHSGGGESEGRVMSIDSSNNEYVTESATGQTPKGASATFIGDLPRSNIDTLNLMVCNGGNIDDDNNLARAFKFHHNIDKVRAWDGNVSFWPGTSNGRISIKGSKEFKEKYGRSPKGEITY